MKNFKRIIKSSFAIVLALIMLFGVACAKTPPSNPTPPEEPPVVLRPSKITFYQERLDLIVGDKQTNVALVDVTADGLKMVYDSVDESIATVNEDTGEVEAINEGETKIIASYGEISNEYTVKVQYLDGILPSVVTSETATSFSVAKYSTYKFEPKIKYNNKIFNDGEFNYRVEGDSTVLESLGEGLFKANNSGTATVVIEADWKKFKYAEISDLTLKFNLTVVDDFIVNVEGLDGDFVQVYTLASFGGKNYETSKDFEPIVTVNGDELDSSCIQAIEIADTEIATYENKKIVAKKYGETVANVKVVYNELEIVNQYKIFVERPIAKFDKTVKYFSSEKGTLRDETSNFEDLTLSQYIYGKASSEEIVDATIEGEQLTVSNNKIYGLTKKVFEPEDENDTNGTATEVTIQVGSATEIYEVDLIVYGMYIYEVDDLNVFIRGEDDTELDCYVELGRDIDVANTPLRVHFTDNPESDLIPTETKSDKQIKGFKGTFDGKGHKISNLTTANYGLFCVTFDASIKNIAFENVNITGGGMFAENIINTEFENVYVKVATMSGYEGASNVFSPFVVRQGNFKNIFVDAQAVKLDAQNINLRGAFVAIEHACIPNATPPIFENCLVLSDLPVGVNVSVTNTATKPLTESSSVQLLLAENVFVNNTEKAALMEHVWNNTAFASAKKYFRAKYVLDNLDKFPDVKPDEITETNVVSALVKMIAEVEAVNGPFNITSETLNTYGKVIKQEGVRSYKTENEVKADPNTLSFFESFIGYDYWSMVDGMIIWGEVDINAEDGEVYLNVGSLAGHWVEGFSGNPLTPNIGDEIRLNKLSCFGYKFIGWKSFQTGQIFYATDGLDYIIVEDNYNGKAMEFVAVWEVDPNVSVSPEYPL